MIPSSNLKWFILLLFTTTITSASSFVWSIPYRCSHNRISQRRINYNNKPPFAISPRQTTLLQPSPNTKTLPKPTILSSSSTTSPESNDTPPPPPPTTTRTDAILQAAAHLTTTTSPLLGTKSLGIDYGLARTGIAVTIGYTPQPLAILPSANTTQLIAQILQTVENERVERIVLGLPVHKNGTESEQTVVTREFAGGLVVAVAKRFGVGEVGGRVPIYLWDERYTSKEAAARARSVDPGVDTYKQLDAEAACIILEYYYEDGGLEAEEVRLSKDEGVMEEVERAWVEGRDERERERVARMQKREDCLNARQLAMDRSKVLEEKLVAENGNFTSGKKNKKKKKRKKRGGRIIL